MIGGNLSVQNSIFQKAQTWLEKYRTIIRYGRDLRNLGRVSMADGLQTDQRGPTSNRPCVMVTVWPVLAL